MQLAKIISAGTILALTLAPTQTEATAETVRVAIMKERTGILVTSNGAGITVARPGDDEKESQVYKDPVSVKKLGSGYVVNQTFYLAGPTISLTPSKGGLAVAGRRYNGSLLLTDSGAGRFHVVNLVDIEDYVAGVIEKEMSPTWHIEALKAQAVASRSYALYQKKLTADKSYDLESTTASQVYGGASGSPRSLEAVEATRGELALYDGDVAVTYFHAIAGGRTEHLPNVWPGDEKPYLVSRPAHHEEEAPSYNWRHSVTGRQMGRKLTAAGYRAGEVTSVRIDGYTPAGRAVSVTVTHAGPGGSVTLSGSEFRRALGYRKLRSTRFVTTRDTAQKSFIFAGTGYGHGVGMSQWSARGMAERGSGYKEILTHFYPGVEVAKIPAPVAKEEKSEGGFFAFLFGD